MLRKKDIICLIQIPILIYGLIISINGLKIYSFSLSVIRIAKFAACISLVINLMCFFYYLLNYSAAVKIDNKKWTGKRKFALVLTLFLAVMSLLLFISGSIKDGFVVLFGFVLGLIFLFTGKIPDWYIEFTQKYNFFTGGFLTKDDDSSNISPKIYIPVLLGAVLIAIMAYFVFL